MRQMCSLRVLDIVLSFCFGLYTYAVLFTVSIYECCWKSVALSDRW